MALACCSSIQILLPFDGKNYEFWSIKMRTYFRAKDLWDVVNNGITTLSQDISTLSTSQKEEAKENQIKDSHALLVLQLSLTDELFPIIMNATSSKEAWDELRVVFDESVDDDNCHLIVARLLTIAHGLNPIYWAWTTSCPADSKFPEVAELLHVWWLYIEGRIATQVLIPTKKHEAYLVYKLRENATGLRDVIASVRFAKDITEENKYTGCSVVLVPTAASIPGATLPKLRDDGWLEIKLGEIFNNSQGGEVVMQLMEVEDMSTIKRGLIVAGMEVRPKELLGI